MRALVTGGAGFIGSNLAEALVSEGHDVIVLDNFFLGREENLEKIRGKIQLVRGDIRDSDLLLKLTKNVDVIFNQAAASSSPMFRENLREALTVNIDGFVHILNAAKINNVARVIYASTSSIYGNNPPPLTEDMSLVPVNFYASSKLMNEHLAVLYSIEYGLETIGLRYMSVYGPHEEGKTKFANLVTQFLWSMQKGDQPVVYGDGSQTRDFTYVRDVCQANLLAAKSKKKHLGDVFNVGTGKAVSLNDLISILNRLLGKGIKPKYISVPVKNYINVQQADITKIGKALGYKPQYTLEKGVAEMLEKEENSITLPGVH